MLWATLNGLLALAWSTGKLQVSAGRTDRLLGVYNAIVTDGLRSRPASRPQSGVGGLPRTFTAASLSPDIDDPRERVFV